MNRFLAIVTAGLGCVASAAGQVISYPNFSATAGLSLTGSATLSSNTIQLTPAITNQAGAVWYTSPVDVQGSFTTTFSYTISGESPADGFAFVIQNSPSGASFAGNNSLGEPVGTNGLSNSVAIAFRTYTYNDAEIDACGAGNAQTIGANPPISGGPCVISSIAESLTGTNTIQINYEGGTLTVYLNGTQILSSAVNLASAINLASGGAAYVGFTAGTGSGDEVDAVIETEKY